MTAKTSGNDLETLRALGKEIGELMVKHNAGATGIAFTVGSLYAVALAMDLDAAEKRKRR